MKVLRSSNNSEKGFTLIEFIAIVSIFAIIASILLFNFSGFNSNVSLSRLSHDIGLIIRDAQVRGQSGQSDTGDVMSRRPVGVFFTASGSTGFADEFIQYRSIDGNDYYNQNPNNDIKLDMIRISTDGTIADIQTGNGNNLSSCNQNVSIAFKRPDPEPLVYCGQSNPPESKAQITVTVPDGTSKSIVVHPTGQIEVE